MIFLPVRPASPMGPPITKLPQGLMWYLVSGVMYCLGMVVSTTFSMMSFLKASRVTFSECWQETTTVWTLQDMLEEIQKPKLHLSSNLVGMQAPFSK